MADRKLYVVFSMDCLPAVGGGEVEGPSRWDEAESRPAAFAEALAEAGLKGTFFFAPEALGRMAETAAELGSGSDELGLLCHPRLSGYQACLGSYGYDRQREIIGLARKTWESRLGKPPRTFRGGFFSANDYTFHAVCMEGFRQGSCSLPGRRDEDQCSTWSETYPFPHHTDPLDRTAAGSMEFYEVPVSSDFEAGTYTAYETYTPPHLRIEEPDIHAYAEDLVERQLDRMAEDQVDLRTIHFVTSNLVGWGEEEDPHVERLGNLCTMLQGVAEQREIEIEPVCLEDLHRRADELAGLEWDLLERE